MRGEKEILKNLGNFETLITHFRSYNEKVQSEKPRCWRLIPGATYQSVKQMVESGDQSKKGVSGHDRLQVSGVDGIETLRGVLIMQ